MAGTLIAHCGARRVSHEELYTFAPPASTPTWRPIAHAELLAFLEAELQRRSMRIAQEAYAVQREGALLFGVLDLS